mgnify:CR=1 FL=1
MLDGVNAALQAERSCVFPGEPCPLRVTLDNPKWLPLVWLTVRFPLEPGGALRPEHRWETVELPEGGVQKPYYEKNVSFLLGHQRMSYTSRLQAEHRGLLCSNGLGMLVAQAKAAAERFLDRAIPDNRVEEITRQMERQTQNLLLIGMPGCGKTTVGQILTDRLGRPLADVDHQVEAEAGCSIPDLFAQEGEEGFRVREHRALCQLSKQSGQVIACGGGIVTRRENRDPIRQNSTVIYLRRDLELLPTSGRPVSQAIPLEELYRRRAPLYEELADLTVENRGTPEETAEEIIRRLAL